MTNWGAIDAIAERYMLPPRPPGSFTLNEYADRYKLHRIRAQGILDQLVSDGKLRKQQAVERGKRVNVYWIPEDLLCPKSGRGTKTTIRHGG